MLERRTSIASIAPMVSIASTKRLTGQKRDGLRQTGKLSSRKAQSQICWPLFGRHSSRLSIRQVPATWEACDSNKESSSKIRDWINEADRTSHHLGGRKLLGTNRALWSIFRLRILRQLSISVFIESRLHGPCASPSTTSVYGTSHNCNTTKSFLSLFLYNTKTFQAQPLRCDVSGRDWSAAIFRTTVSVSKRHRKPLYLLKLKCLSCLRDSFVLFMKRHR